jgi:O-antigen/teichoic acid export membrane protein
MGIVATKKIVVLLLCFILVCASVPNAALAQIQNETSVPELSGTRKQVATIIFSGLAGSILGLSTLSFYGRPQERLSNIAVGFAIGIIGGVIYTTYNVARSPYEGLQSMRFNHEDELSRRFAAGGFEPAYTPAFTWSF